MCVVSISLFFGNGLLMDQIYSENPFNYDENDLGKKMFSTEIHGSPFFSSYVLYTKT